MSSDHQFPVATANSDTGPVDAGAILRFVWDARWAMLIGVTLALGVAVSYLHVATYKYRAELRITPAQGGGAGLGGNIGALASLAGADLGSFGGSKEFPAYIESLKSRAVAEHVSSDEALMRHIFADQWDPTRGVWAEPEGFLYGFVQSARTMLGAPAQGWRRPDAAALQDYIEKHVVVQEDSKRAIARISVTDRDPEFAASLLTQLHEASDNNLRKRTLDRANNYISYLELRLPTVTIAEQREALAKALSDQEKLRMQASASVGYAAEELGVIAVSPRPVTPRPTIVLAIAVACGAVLGLLVVLVLRSRQQAKQAST